MVNPWIEHVKKFAADNNISYGCAISLAAKTYVKKESSKDLKSRVTEKLKTLSGEEMVKLFTPLKKKSSFDLADPNRDEVIKKLFKLRFNEPRDWQMMYDKIVKYKSAQKSHKPFKPLYDINKPHPN